MNDMARADYLEQPILLNDDERQRCEIWTRVMGYHRPVSSFNIGKKGEFHERRFFEEARVNASNDLSPPSQEARVSASDFSPPSQGGVVAE
jgi:hypothetical protein